MSPFRTGVVTTTERREFATLVFLLEYIEHMQYYKSNLGGVYKVYAGDPTTGKLTIILNYKNLNMYNVLNQQLSVDASSGSSEYQMYVSSLETCTRTDFLALLGPTKTFLDSL